MFELALLAGNYMCIGRKLEELNKNILRGCLEFYKLKEDIHWFIDFYKKEIFNFYLFNFSDDGKV